MKFEKIDETIVCHLESGRYFFISPKDISTVASLDSSRIRIHSRKNVNHVIYIDDNNRQLKLNRILAGCIGDSTLAVLPSNDNPIDLRFENLMIEKLGFNNVPDFNKRKTEQAESLHALPKIKLTEQLALSKKVLSSGSDPNSIQPKRGKISLNPINDNIDVVVEDFHFTIKKDNPYQNAKNLSTFLKDSFDVVLE
ncbi:hypothetical protein ACFSFY_02150 [Sporosarcina siberiensis]|uniref:Uncharacterized protein n=1 Tax=Sporosarcina siberiensis TaxID=1365606 RepID=A0ABW4SDJ9_9BACL